MAETVTLFIAMQFKLIKTAPDRQLVETLEELLASARAGQLNGLAYVATEKGREYSADLVGNIKSTPLIALGVVKVLEEAVVKLVGPVV